jgi:hypothetical protein
VVVQRLAGVPHVVVLEDAAGIGEGYLQRGGTGLVQTHMQKDLALADGGDR